MRTIKSLFLFFVLSGIALPVEAQQWIGAITKADAHIPDGRSFSGGKLKGQAKLLWEGVDSLSRRSIVVAKTFKAQGVVRKAEAKICGLGFYEFTINGEKVGESVFAPLWSDYDKTVWYNTYDVTKQLKKGMNSLAVLLGNGFYNEQGGRYAKMRISFGPPTLWLDMTVTYQNGTTEHIVSDGSWAYRSSPITFNSIYGGEDYDARLEGTGNWQPVVVQEGPKGVLREQIAEPVKIMERFGVVRLVCCDTIATNGTQKQDVDAIATNGTEKVGRKAPFVVFDMGQNLAGFPEITVKGKAGQTVKLMVGETLTADGHVNQRQTGRPHYYVYTLKGEGVETWHPHFSYYGFRYIEVEGADCSVLGGKQTDQQLPQLLDLKSCFVYNSARKIGEFECSNPLFNETYRIIDRAIRSNWQGVWTDCPHREKLGWLEQDWLNGEGLIYNYDCRRMIEQTMQVVADAQHADGSMPEIAPEYTVFEGSWAKPFLESPEWGGALVALPMLYRSYYGDDKLIQRYYDHMKRYVDYLHTQDSCYILNQGLGDWYDYGEGKAGFSKNTPVTLVATAHYALWTYYTAFAAEKLGKAGDVETLKARTRKIIDAFNKEFYHPDTHQYGTGSQASNAIPLSLGFVPKELKDSVLAQLVADIHAHGDRLTTGDVGTRYLFDALWKNHQGELFYKILNHYDVPGYGYQIKKGATTLTEQWNPEHGASQNHFMMAHVNNHLIPHIVGIDIIKGKVAVIRPHVLGDMTWARGATEVNGRRVAVSWKVEDGKFIIDIDVPNPVLLRLPSGKRIEVTTPGHHQYVEVWKR